MLAMLAAFTLCLGARAAITTEGLVAYYPFDGDILESRGDRPRVWRLFGGGPLRFCEIARAR